MSPCLPVTCPNARNSVGDRFVLGHATTALGARRVLAKWLHRPVAKARVTRVGRGSGLFQWEEHRK